MPKSGAKYNNDLRVLERRKNIASLYLQGKSQTEIGLIVNVSQVQVSDDIRLIRKAWMEQMVRDYDEKIAIEVAGIEWQIDQLCQAWAKSCEVERIRTKSVEKGKAPNLDESTDAKPKKKRGSVSDMVVIKESTKVQSKQLIGDPRYMSEITKLRELRCKLLGIIKPDEKTINNQINVLPPEFWEAMDKGAAIHVEAIDDEIVKLQALALPPKPDLPTSPSRNGTSTNGDGHHD